MNDNNSNQNTCLRENVDVERIAALRENVDVERIVALRENVYAERIAAFSLQVPLILILDASNSSNNGNDMLESTLKQFLDKLYEFNFNVAQHDIPLARISLSVFSNIGKGCVLLPPRLIREQNEDYGLDYFKTYPVINIDSIKKHLTSLPYGNETNDGEVFKLIKKMLIGDGNIPPAYNVDSNEDASPLIIYMTMRNNVQTSSFDVYLQNNAYIKNLRKSLTFCLWNINNTHMMLPNPAQGDNNLYNWKGTEFCYEWLNNQFNQLSNGIYENYRRNHEHNTDIFPDVLFPSHCLQPLPMVEITASNKQVYCAVAICLQNSGEQTQDDFSATLQLEMSPSVILDETADNEIHVEFIPSMLRYTGSRVTLNKSDPFSKLYTLKINCKRNCREQLYTGNIFKAIISLKSSSVKICLYGAIWIPPANTQDIIIPGENEQQSKSISQKSESHPKILFISLLVCGLVILLQIALIIFFMYRKPTNPPNIDETKTIKKIDEELKSFITDKEQFKKDLNDTMKEVKELKNKRENENSKDKEVINKLQNDLLELRNKIKTLEEDIKKKTSLLQNKEEEIKKLKTDLKTKESHLAVVEKALTEKEGKSIASIKKNYEKLLREANTELQKNTKELQTVSGNNNKLKQDVDEKNNQLNTIRVKLTEVEKQLAEASTKNNNEKIKNEKILKETQNELNKIKDDIAVSKNNLTIAQNNLTEKENELTKIKREFEKTKNELATAKSDLEKSKKEIDKTNETLNVDKNNLIRAKNNLSEKEKELATTKSELDKANKELKIVNNELNTIKNKQIGNAVILETKLKEREEELKVIEKKLKDSQTIITKNGTTIENLKNENIDLKQQNLDLKRKLVSGREENTTLKPPKTLKRSDGISPERRLEIKKQITKQMEALDKEVYNGRIGWREVIKKNLALTLKKMSDKEERKYVYDLYREHLNQRADFSGMYIFEQYCTPLIKE